MWQRKKSVSGGSYFGTGLASALLAAGATYLLDPQSGRRRRALLRDQFTRAARRTQDFFGKAGRDARARARGVYSESRAWWQRENLTDESLRERVLARVGRLCSHPGAIQVNCEGGILRLSGDILEDELDTVLRGLRRVRGVKEIANELSVHREPGNIPGLQGERRIGPFAGNWPPAPRVLAGGAGLALLIAGLTWRRGSRSPLSYALAAGGAGLLGRSVWNRPVTRFVRRRALDQGLLVQKTLDVYADVDEVYSAWRNLEAFPKFMSHVREVQKRDERLYHWVVDGPAGVPVEWDAEVTADVPQELIAWRSTQGSTVQSSGVVQFEPNSYGGTRIHIRMSYRPPADALGHTVAKVFGRDPKRQIDADLMRFKSFIETGKTAAGPDAATVH